jgi:hypothetical protein
LPTDNKLQTPIREVMRCQVGNVQTAGIPLRMRLTLISVRPVRKSANFWIIHATHQIVPTKVLMTESAKKAEIHLKK